MRDFAPAAMVPSGSSTERRPCTGLFLLRTARPRRMSQSGLRPKRLRGTLSTEGCALHVGGPAVVTTEMDSTDRLGQLVEGFHPADAVEGHAVGPALNLHPDDPLTVLRALAEQLAKRACLDRVVRVIPHHARGRVSDDVVKAAAALVEISRRLDDERIEVVGTLGWRGGERVPARRRLLRTPDDGGGHDPGLADRP